MKKLIHLGTFSNYKGALVHRGLIEKSGGSYVATEVFRERR